MHNSTQWGNGLARLTRHAPLVSFSIFCSFWMAYQSPHVPFLGTVTFVFWISGLNTIHLFLNTRSKFINHLMVWSHAYGAIVAISYLAMTHHLLKTVTKQLGPFHIMNSFLKFMIHPLLVRPCAYIVHCTSECHSCSYCSWYKLHVELFSTSWCTILRIWLLQNDLAIWPQGWSSGRSRNLKREVPVYVL